MRLFLFAMIASAGLSACATEQGVRRTDNYPERPAVSIPTGHSTNF